MAMMHGGSARLERVWLLPVAAASIGLFVVAEIVGAPLGASAIANFSDYANKATATAPALIQLAAAAMMVRVLLMRVPDPFRQMQLICLSRFGNGWLLAAACLPFLLMPLLFSGFGILKMLIPVAAPFSWDATFAAADRALFFGYQPWRLTHALFGGEITTLVIDRLYTGWIAFLSLAIAWAAVGASRYDRARFFLTFTAVWIVLGVVGATMLSSAGPCFAAAVGADADGEFAPLMVRLAVMGDSLGAVGWQQVLWDAHVARRYGFGMGISAMPSLHNAIAVLYALALSRRSRALGRAGWIYAAIIWVGSIHLGWHYAVDGLVAAAATIGLWTLAGRYLAHFGYSPDLDWLHPGASGAPALAP